MNDKVMHSPTSRNRTLIPFLMIAASLLLAVAIHVLATDGAHLLDVFAGWILAIGTFGMGHLLLHFAKKRPAQPLFALGVIKFRLFSLILVYLVVLVGEIFRAGPFTTGMLCGYLVAGWVETGTLAREFLRKQS
jgi:hypothetical protein